MISSNLERWRPGGPLQSLVLGPSFSPRILAGEVKIIQSCVPPGARAVPVDPEQSLPRSFPGGPAAIDDAASIFEGLMLAAGDEHISSVSTKGRARLSQYSEAGGFIGVMNRRKYRFLGQVCGRI